MRALLQRVSSSSVRVDGRTVGSISAGLLVLLGVRRGDGPRDAAALAEKCSVLRVFPDDDGKMNRSVQDTGGEVLVVSQFTLYGDSRKGTRPSYSDAAPPDEAQQLYNAFCGRLREVLGHEKVSEGVFGAMMEVELVNNGPVTLIVETKDPGHPAS